LFVSIPLRIEAERIIIRVRQDTLPTRLFDRLGPSPAADQPSLDHKLKRLAQPVRLRKAGLENWSGQ